MSQINHIKYLTDFPVVAIEKADPWTSQLLAIIKGCILFREPSKIMKNVYAGLQRRKNMDFIVVQSYRSRGETVLFKQFLLFPGFGVW